MDVEALLEWYEGVRRPLPWRFTRDPYALLVSEVMLQQTQALRVVPYYSRWLERFPSAAALAERAGAGRAALWSGLGYNRRALALQRAAGVVASSGWPSDLTDAAGGGAVYRGGGGVVRVGRAGRGRGHQRAAGALAARRRRAVAARARRAGRLRCCRGAGGDLQPGDDGARRDRLPPARARVGVPGRVRLSRAVAGGRRGEPAVRFEDTDRWARGRVVAALLAGESRRSRGPRERALAGLERDGLIVRGPDGSARLP